uniref:Uncharacterized protein n=1 Tax=Coccidioides posadasii RMSCC 3488 TaxID=454284 RepID=A0A0J6FEG5_COCPO|nr:hypothetical protein CPAG_07853 [Coccidioides posadasii RMSCC 3488]
MACRVSRLMQLLAVSWFEMLIPVNNSKVSITYPPELLKLN